MCRFNLIMINDESACELLQQEEYLNCYDNLYGYRVYQKGYCNCGSFVGSLIERKGMKYQDAIAIIRKEKLERLYQIKNIMTQPRYKEIKENFLQTRSDLSDDLNTFSKHIRDYEVQQTDLIHNEYSGEVLNNQIEKLYQEIENLFTSLEAQTDYAEKHKFYMDFIHDNQLLQESMCFCLSKEEEKKIFSNSIPLSVLFDVERNFNPQKIEMVQVPSESNIIDEVIARTEIETFTEHLDEYNDYYKLFSAILELVPSLMFCTIWSRPNELKKVKTVGLSSLIIDDLAFLDYDEMICITK